jgi:hypothetical protein
MFAAPELVIAELVELLHEIEIAAELQHRMLADRVMRGEESSEFQAGHDGSCAVEAALAVSLVSQLCAGFNVSSSDSGNAFCRHAEEARGVATSAADLKSLIHSRRNGIQGLQIESGTRIIDLPVP